MEHREIFNNNYPVIPKILWFLSREKKLNNAYLLSYMYINTNSNYEKQKILNFSREHDVTLYPSEDKSLNKVASVIRWIEWNYEVLGLSLSNPKTITDLFDFLVLNIDKLMLSPEYQGFKEKENPYRILIDNPPPEAYEKYFSDNEIGSIQIRSTD